MLSKKWIRSGAVFLAAGLLAALVAPMGVTAASASTKLTQGSYEEASPGVTFAGSWKPMTNAADSGGRSTYANGTASFSFTFVGTGVSWIARTSPSSGISTVAIDGQLAGTVDRYSATTKFQQTVFSSSTLGAGTHTMTVQFDGSKNAAATGASAHLDSLRVEETSSAVGLGTIEQDDPAVSYTGTWSTSTNALDSGGDSVSASTAATASLTFRGTDITWLGRRSSAAGIAQVTIDGVRQPDVDRYSSTNDYQQELFRKSDLSDQVHTITITWTKTMNSASRGTSTHLDAFVVRGEETPVVPGIYEEKSSAVSFTGPWSTSPSSGDSGGQSAYSSSKSSVSLTFDATSIAWIGRTSASSGIAAVFIDGTQVATVDRYAPTISYRKTLYSTEGLSAGPHTIRVEWSGKQNASASSSAMHFDAFSVSDAANAFVAPPGVVGDNSTAIVYEGPWTTSNNSGEQGGQSRYAMTDAKATLTFSGTGIAWIGRKSPGSGIAKVTLDGVEQTPVDRYSAGTSYQQTLFLKQGLPAGTHKIQIQWTGKKNAAATSASIHLDAFVVSDLSATKPGSVTLVPGVGTAPALGSKITWVKPATKSSDALTYRLNRTDAAGVSTQIDLPTSTSYVDSALAETTAFAYRLAARDRWGFTSQASTAVSRTTGSLGVNKTLGTSRCASPTKTVTNGDQLQTAINAAKPGDTIKLAPGTYRGKVRAAGLYTGFTFSGIHGTQSAPISICGASDAKIDLGDSGADYASLNSGFLLRDSSWIRLERLNIEQVHAGVEMLGSTRVVMDYLKVSDTAQAGIYLSKNSSDNVIAHTTITATGKKDPRFGEGIYIGSSLGNDTCEPACAADRSDRNVIAYNTISGTTGEAIEAKEQTVDGTIYKNTVGATQGTNDITGSSLQIKGSRYVLYQNSIASSLEQGVRVLAGKYSDGATWGENNIVTRNSISFTRTTASSLAVYGFGSNGTVIKCSNNVTPTSVKLSPAACLK